MNIYQIRQLLRQGVSIFDLELNVSYYARVSTDKEEQKNSIINQEAYFKDFISKYPKWHLVQGYVDDGISGLHTQKRENFQNMLDDARNGIIDLVLTKEITRFARNTLDSIQYTRQMLSYGTCIWFINDNINTIDEDSELRLTIMSGIAQDEVRKLSSRIRFGHAQSIKKGVVLGNSLFYGYDKKDGKLTINEKEAEMIRLIFTLYATGDWSTRRLEKHLYEIGYKNHNGNAISNKTIQQIIQNPKYKGFYCGGKVKIIDMFTKKQEFLPPEEWVMYKDDGETVPAIVSEELWNQANEIYAKKSEIIRSRKTSIKSDSNLLTGKIICGIDGHAYWLKSRVLRGREDLKWRCSYKVKNGKDSCPSFLIDEKEIRLMLADILQQDLGDFSDVIKDYLTEYRKIINPESNGSKSLLETLNKQLTTEEGKKEKLLDLMLADLITQDEFKAKSQKIIAEIAKITDKINMIAKEEDTEQAIIEKLKTIRDTLEKYAGIEPQLINRKIIDELIEKIVVTPTSQHEATVVFYLYNQKEYVKQLVKKQGKKMGCSDDMILTI